MFKSMGAEAYEQPGPSNFFTWFFPEGLFSGDGMIGLPLLVLGLVNLGFAAVLALRGSPPWASAPIAFSWLIGMGGTPGGIHLIRRAFLKARREAAPPEVEIVDPAYACVACGRELQSILPTVETAVSEAYVRIEHRLGVRCGACGDTYCIDCMDRVFFAEGFARAVCAACDRKHHPQPPASEEGIAATSCSSDPMRQEAEGGGDSRVVPV